MVGDTYRRPRRTHSSDESYAEKFNRYFLRKGPGKAMETVYPKDRKGPSKERSGDPRTIYPKEGFPPKSVKRRFKTFGYGSTLGDLVFKKSNLEKRLGVVSAALIAGSVLFITPNITGSVIWNLSVGNTNFVGLALFVLGLSGMFFCLRKK